MRLSFSEVPANKPSSAYKSYAESLLKPTDIQNPMPPHAIQQFLNTINMSRSEAEWIELIGGIHAEMSYWFRVKNAGTANQVHREGYPDRWHMQVKPR